MITISFSSIFNLVKANGIQWEEVINKIQTLASLVRQHSSCCMAIYTRPVTDVAYHLIAVLICV